MMIMINTNSGLFRTHGNPEQHRPTLVISNLVMDCHRSIPSARRSGHCCQMAVGVQLFELEGQYQCQLMTCLMIETTEIQQQTDAAVSPVNNPSHHIQSLYIITLITCYVYRFGGSLTDIVNVKVKSTMPFRGVGGVLISLS